MGLVVGGGGGGGGDGGSSPTSLVGPIPITFDEFGGTGGNFPIKIVDLGPGQWVTDVVIAVTEAWDGTTPLILPAIAPTADLTDASDLGEATNAANVADGASPTYQLFSIAAQSTRGFRIKPARCVAGASVIVYQTNGGTPSQGAADVYAWLYTPA